MQTLHMKIHKYDEENKSLLVSFSSDESLKPLGEYRQYSFQLKNFIGKTSEEILNHIARTGSNIVKIQNAEETVSSDANLIDIARSLDGTEHEYEIADLDVLTTNESLPNLTKVVT